MIYECPDFGRHEVPVDEDGVDGLLACFIVGKNTDQPPAGDHFGNQVIRQQTDCATRHYGIPGSVWGTDDELLWQAEWNGLTIVLQLADPSPVPGHLLDKPMTFQRVQAVRCAKVGHVFGCCDENQPLGENLAGFQ